MSTNSEVMLPFQLEDIENPLIAKNESNYNTRPLTMAELKQEYMHQQMLKRSAEYTVDNKISIHCVTWNINGRDVDQDLKFLLPSLPTDIIVFGFQEADRSAEAYMTAATGRKEILISGIQSALNEVYGQNNRFMLLSSRILVGLFIAVFTKEELSSHVGHVSTSSVACGMMGMIGNKGAVAVRFKLYNSYLCFVNCHLAAHTEQVYRRNQDMTEIHRRLQFNTAKTGTETKFDFLADKYLGIVKTAGVDECDILIWLGDFNYRVAMESKLARIFIDNGQLGPLLEKDQMKMEREKGGILQKYTEAAIRFAPSYYFDVGTDRYDSSEKQRVPSYCDRIIWRDGDKVQPEAYDCISNARSSDHKPVAFIASATVQNTDKEKFEKVFSEVLKQLDIFENETIPDTDVDSNIVCVTDVPYFQVSTSSFHLRNKGKVPAQFRFVPPGGSEGLAHPHWIRVSPEHGLLMPNGTVEISVLFIYDNEIARKALQPAEPIESILILHIEGGRDHFIAASMTCRSTDFGRHLENLKYHRVVLDRRRPSDIFKVPTVLWRLVDFLMKPGGIEMPNLFLLAGEREITVKIQNSLDMHEAFDESLDLGHAFYAAAELILRYFEALPDSIIPSTLFHDCIEASNSRDKSYSLMEKMPERNYLLFEYILRFWRDVLLPRNDTLSIDAIIKIMIAIFVRKPDHSGITVFEKRSLYAFFENFFK